VAVLSHREGVGRSAGLRPGSFQEGDRRAGDVRGGREDEWRLVTLWSRCMSRECCDWGTGRGPGDGGPRAVPARSGWEEE